MSIDDIKEEEKVEVKESDTEEKDSTKENKKEEEPVSRVKTIEEFFSDDPEFLEGYKKLEKVGFSSAAFMSNAYESIFKEAYDLFINNNIPRIKNFITSKDKGELNLPEKFDIVVEGTTYRFKDELFVKADSYKSSEKGNVDLYLLDFKELQNEVNKLPENLFDDIKESLEKENKEFDLEKERTRFNLNLEDIAVKLNEEVRRNYIDEKMNFADIDAIDSIFNEDHFKLVNDRMGDINSYKINTLNLSTKNIESKIIKKISKDIIKLGEKSTKQDAYVIATMVSQISEFWSLLLYYRKERYEDLNLAIGYIKEHEKDKDIKLFMAYNRNFMYKLFYEAFKLRISRIVIPALVKAFYSYEDITKSYLFDKLYNEVLKLYPITKDEIKEKETPETAR